MTLSPMIRKGSQEKFSYVVIEKQVRQRRSPNEWTELSVSNHSRKDGVKDMSPEAACRLPNTDERTVDSASDEFSEELGWRRFLLRSKRNEWGRVLRSPMKRRKHVIIDTCSCEGAIKRSVISRKSFQYIEAFYTSAKKTTWGGLYPVTSVFSPLNTTGNRSRDHHYSMYQMEEKTEKVEQTKKT